MAVTVIDALMGQGKTQHLFRHMRENADKRFIYIGVNLEEADRATRECPELNFRNPIPRQGRKYWDLIEQVKAGNNIASTHQLFRFMASDLHEALEGKGYTLVIDEALDVVSQYSISEHDWQILTDDEVIYVEEGSSRLRWNHEKWPEYAGQFRELQQLCDNGNLVQTRRGILMWQFPAEFLSVFDQVYIATYMFEGQVMADYFKAEGVNYQLMAVMNGRIFPHGMVRNRADKLILASLITVIDSPRYNDIGNRSDKSYPLSQSWYAKRYPANADRYLKQELGQLKRNTAAFFREHGQGAHSNMWTCFKEYRNQVRGPRYAHYGRCFVPMNAKATDDYKHKTALAYLVDRHQSPIVEGYFRDRGVHTRSDLFALTELIQWIWRSAIRHRPIPGAITLYLPSQRMRDILTAWIRYSDAEIVAGQRLDGQEDAHLIAAE